MRGSCSPSREPDDPGGAETGPRDHCRGAGRDALTDDRRFSAEGCARINREDRAGACQLATARRAN
jgi:hypothetical protein